MTPPTIGITLDREQPEAPSPLARYTLRRNYADMVAAAGGLPLLLPYHPDLATAYVERLDGLLVTGGAFDIDPALFGAAERHPSLSLNIDRTVFELAMVRLALERDLPILGICGGEQLLAVALGGTLVQHIPDEIDTPLAHEQANPRDEPGHRVSIVAGTRLSAIAGRAILDVNSTHHQSVKSLPDGLVVNAIAGDGVIEGVELPGRRFCLGVQWHPEYAVSAADGALFRAFVEACRP
ncbi:MAG TPA: gamma-glutamyl-gamma-aminobutyrate hydrolase family protein [Rhodospirillaceae bacterium]|nr:gamma-glutamyl-gamma-aminobutyrate hydrolase family protein [Rhodospirillaceae bacterium]